MSTHCYLLLPMMAEWVAAELIEAAVVVESRVPSRLRLGEERADRRRRLADPRIVLGPLGDGTCGVLGLLAGFNNAVADGCGEGIRSQAERLGRELKRVEPPAGIL